MSAREATIVFGCAAFATLIALVIMVIAIARKW
jgi:hypothetical protein